jgi:uncharacterized protein (TIGR02391 family)
MPQIHMIVPDPQALLALETPEAALVLLKCLATSADGPSPQRPVFLGNFFSSTRSPVNGYIAKDPNVDKYADAITEHLIMAWQWLIRENLLIPAPGNTAGWVCVSSRGHKAVDPEVFDRYRHAALLPQGMVHPAIVATAFASFLRGDYDLAIFASYRALEDRVREVCKLSQDLVGVKLMRAAFDPKSGPLRDSSRESGEQEAMAHVYAGAIGLFKNPTSHRLNAFDKAEQAVSLVLFATYLINQVDDLARINGLI